MRVCSPGYCARSLAANPSSSKQSRRLDGGDATFCAEEVGDIELIELHGGADVLVQKGAFLVSHDTVELRSTTQLSARKVVHCPRSQP
jgi:uncharacterized protein (AIM24 family)